jgi:hypothetical protein
MEALADIVAAIFFCTGSGGKAISVLSGKIVLRTAAFLVLTI